MRVFIIPSWYPSPSHPYTGIFIREQAALYARNYPGDTLGIGTWGPSDERLLLWSRAPLGSLAKLIRSRALKAEQHVLTGNLTEYFHPALTWSRKVFSGNLQGLVRATMKNYELFSAEYGPADVIHAHVGYPAGAVARELSRRHDIPFVITEHMSPFPFRDYMDRDGSLMAELAGAYRHAAAVIAVSDKLRDTMHNFGVERVEVVPNFIDESFFQPLKRYGGQGQSITFFSLGRLVPQKGFDILLEAFARVHRRYPEASIRFGGGGEERLRLQQLAEKLGLGHRVQWLGELDRDRVREEMQRCDAFVLASRHESLGIVLIEAIACGRPVIGTSCGGPEEIVNGTNGYLVPPEDPDSLAAAMLRMIENHGAFDSTAIRRDFEARFSSAVVCGMVREVYHRVIKGS